MNINPRLLRKCYDFLRNTSIDHMIKKDFGLMGDTDWRHIQLVRGELEQTTNIAFFLLSKSFSEIAKSEWELEPPCCIQGWWDNGPPTEIPATCAVEPEDEGHPDFSIAFRRELNDFLDRFDEYILSPLNEIGGY